jgi:type I restriction enzyme, S subunit
MRSRLFGDQLSAVQGETDMAPYVSLTAQRRLRIALPSSREQIAVGKILSLLDDKIELNRRMAETLEAMARALFRSWFVDFEPVHARLESRSPGLPDDLAALFPDSFGAGGLPANWAGAADDIAELIRVSVQPRDVEPTTPYVGLEHSERGSLTLYRHGFASNVDSLKHKFRTGDLLFGKLRPYFNKVAIAPFNGVCSSDIFVFRARHEVPVSLLYLSFSEPAFVATASNASSGTRMPRADWKYMRRLPVVMPSPPLAAAFEQVVRPLLDRMISSARECSTLASLRDTLLPKLISGELRITDAETRVAAA